jgi:RNA polymerase sigma-70 factor (ECF subfamily)
VSARRGELESALLPHLDAGYNLARWLVGNDSEANDVVQSACVRAIQYFSSLRGSDAKPWFLGIVRNTCMTALKHRGERAADIDVESLLESPAESEALGAGREGPLEPLLRRDVRERVNRVLRQLPAGFKEVLVLREMEELSYDDIAHVTGVPIGTVMSRLSRARRQFRAAYALLDEESARD